MIKGKNLKEIASKSLRTLPTEKAFYFYREIGHPLGVAASSLTEFADLLKKVEPASIKFHLERGDFQNWLRMLGEDPLCEKLDALKGRNITEEELKSRVSALVSSRVNQLRRAAGSV
jgi:hypothetical protein